MSNYSNLKFVKLKGRLYVQTIILMFQWDILFPFSFILFIGINMLLEEVIQAQQAASQFYIKLTLMTGLLMSTLFNLMQVM